MSSSSADDHAWMRRALALAPRGWGRTAPNPMVGCVLVRDGEVVGEGWHHEYGMPHAEVEALRQAGEGARGATAYVTLEPCSHHGKTPPCSDALIAAGVARVVYAASDPNPRAAGGAAALRAAKVEVRGGVEAQAARDLDPVFFHLHSPAGAERPFVALKLALSLDARVADGARRSRWISGEAARAETHRLRAGYAAIAVGSGTALDDDPLLTVRGAVTPRVAPTRVVFDSALRLPLQGQLVRSQVEAPLWVVTAPGADPSRRAALEAAGVQVLEAGEGLENALKVLRQAGIGSMFVEGGAALAGSLLRAGLADRLYLFYAPLLLGPGGLSPFAALDSPPIGEAARWRTVASERCGDDTLLTLARE